MREIEQSTLDALPLYAQSKQGYDERALSTKSRLIHWISAICHPTVAQISPSTAAPAVELRHPPTSNACGGDSRQLLFINLAAHINESRGASKHRM
jgi:hypothetical protein